MRILYADPGLRGPEGHLASSGIAIPPAFRRLGHHVTVLAHCDLVESLQKATGALPFFRAYTWGRWSSDPLVGWLVDFSEAVDLTVADLHQAWAEFGPFDLIYINTARAAQLAAAERWLREAFPDQATGPAVAIQLGPDSGLIRSTSSGAQPFDIRDPTTILHRYVTRGLGNQALGRLVLLAVNRVVAEEYSFIVDMPVKPMPTPEALPAPCRRNGGKALTIGFLGHQRIDKGYELLPDLIAQVLRTRTDVRFIVQHSDPEGLATEDPPRIARVTARLHDLALQQQRVEMLLQPFVGDAWFALIARCDIVVLPYDPPRYASSYSAIFGEALASGATIVVPSKTTMALEMERAGGVGTTFDDWTASSVAVAVEAAIDRFDDLSDRAHRAGITWAKKHGPDAYASAVIDATGLGDAAGMPGSTAPGTKASTIGRPLPATFLRRPRLQNGAAMRTAYGVLERKRGPFGWLWIADRAGKRLRQQLFSSILDVAIETSPVPWCYALTFEANSNLLQSVPVGSRIMVEVVMEVIVGAIGVAWLDENYRLASIERIVREAPGTQRVVVVAPQERARRLMLRNVGLQGAKALFKLKQISATASAG